MFLHNKEAVASLGPFLLRQVGQVGVVKVVKADGELRPRHLLAHCPHGLADAVHQVEPRHDGQVRCEQLVEDLVGQVAKLAHRGPGEGLVVAPRGLRNGLARDGRAVPRTLQLTSVSSRSRLSAATSASMLASAPPRPAGIVRTDTTRTSTRDLGHKSQKTRERGTAQSKWTK